MVDIHLFKMKTGQNLYKKAKKIIPGGTMLLSKRPEMFLPENWPSYFSKAKGAKLWDLDNNEYVDMSIMGIGTNSLGYGNDEVDEAVSNTIRKGNLSTLNCPEEVYLAEKIIDINPWADMVRFARTGGEANAIAVRIARASSGKNKVAICGYHGWHDWYLSANIGSKNSLNTHILPGLNPLGVPTNLEDTVFPFDYNNLEMLNEICDHKDIGVIKMEVIRNIEPKDNFLEKVRDLATKRGIVLIFDECSSGFRESFGGIFNNYSVYPDMAMFGKTIGNGYALTAVVGKESVMKSAQDTFISSTFWTERIGPTAALKTLEVMEKVKSWEIITEIGLKVRKGWNDIAENNDLKINISGIPALSSYSFEIDHNLELHTYITQEMLKKGFLSADRFYASTEHNDEILDKYFDALNDVFSSINDITKSEKNIKEFLEGPVRHYGFKKIN